MRANARVPPFSEEEWARLKRRLSLPAQQAELVRHILCGRSDKQIAREMGISIATVRTYLGRLLSRFGLSSRVQLLLYLLARLRGLTEPPENAGERTPEEQPR